MLNLSASLLLTTAVIPAVNSELLISSSSTESILDDERLEELNRLLEEKKNLLNKKNKSIEEKSIHDEAQASLTIIQKKQNAFKDILQKFSNKKHLLINTEQEYTETLASVLDKMDDGGGKYVSMRISEFNDGEGHDSSHNLYRSSFVSSSSDQTYLGYGRFARLKINENGTESYLKIPSFSPLLSPINTGSLINKNKIHISYFNQLRDDGQQGTSLDFPCNVHKNYKITSGNGLTPTFSSENYEQCDIVGLQKSNLSSVWRNGLGMSFEGQGAKKYRLEITARHPYYEELELKRQKLLGLLRTKNNLKQELKLDSKQVIEALQHLSLSDENAHPDNIQMLVDKINTNL